IFLFGEPLYRFTSSRNIQLQSLSQSIRMYLLRLTGKEEAELSEMPNPQKMSRHLAIRMLSSPGSAET
ncbi:MAG: hypothetical protein WA474_16100, partial [Candidatus Sulfotelmatobacter sp.]